MIEAPAREEAGVRGEALVIRGGPRGSSRTAAKSLGALGPSACRRKNMLICFTRFSMRQRVTELSGLLATSFDKQGWQIAANAVRFVAGEGREDGRDANRYFVSLYETLADALLRWRRGSVWPGRQGTHSAGRSGAARMARMAFPLGQRGPGPAGGSETRFAPSRRARRFPARTVLLANHGIGRRYLRAERGLSAQCPADPSELCATFGARGPVRSGGAGYHLLLGARAA